MAAVSSQQKNKIHSFIVAYWNDDMKFIIYPPLLNIIIIIIISLKKKIFFSLSMPDDDDVMVKTYTKLSNSLSLSSKSV